MGGFSAQVQNGQTGQPSGKGGGDQPISIPVVDQTSSPKPLDGVQEGYFSQAPRPMGKGGAQTNSATSGQPRAGMPNQYSNTVGQWDNVNTQPQQPAYGGKGKG